MDTDQVAHFLELEDKLSKIRIQITSKLDNQKHVAIILSAVEENMQGLKANDNAKNIVNYMISLMSLLDQAIDPETQAIKDLQVATSAIYLLDLIFHYSPKQLLRSKFPEILTKVAPCITDANANAPLIRSALGCLESLLVAQDAQAWNNTHDLTVTPRRGLQGLLELSLDPRPKVRRRATEALFTILSNPPAAPTAEHVAASSVASYCLKSLSNALNELSTISNKKSKANGSDELKNKVIHNLRFISRIVPSNQWPSSQVEPLCDFLLEVTKGTDEYLVTAAFECFESLFNSLAEANASSGLAENKYLNVLDIIFSLKPSNKDTNLAGAWIAVVVKGITSYAAHQPLKCLVKIPDVFKLMSTYLASEAPAISFSASQGLNALLTNAIKDDLLLEQPAIDQESYDIVTDILTQISDLMVEFLSIRYTHCAKEVLNSLSVAFKKFRFRANSMFIKPLLIVDQWRINEANYMDFRNEAETVIGSAIAGMGPDVVLSYLPLNLENPTDNQPGRAWLLPILRDNTKNAKLSTFITELAPLIEFFESKYDRLPSESIQLKIYQTVVDQIWSTLPHFCELPTDLKESFNDEFASHLSSLLYSNVELRTTICHSFKVLVESNSTYIEGALEADVLIKQHFPISQAKENLEYLSTKAVNILSVLFNIYTQTAPNLRGYILETIESFLKITSIVDLEKTFNNVCGLLNNAMNAESQNIEKGKPQLTATLLDLVVCMAKYVPTTSYPALFTIFGTTVASPDALTQKRAYRIITRLSELDAGSTALSNYISDISDMMLSNAETAHTSAKPARLAAIRTLVDILPSDKLDFIVRIVAEVILSTKDVNEQSRESSFETLIAMGKKMNEPNGIIALSKIPGYDPESPDQQSSVSEFFKIIAAGLIGESQHMVSATVIAYACLMFEFKNELETPVLLDIYDTVELYLTSNSREIVKSAIGFTKVCILGLPVELMRPKVPGLLPKLLRWSNQHAGHFKSKVKNIIERLIRRFGYDYIEQHFPEQDRRLLSNIRKARNKSKRKDDEEEETDKPATTASSSKGSRFLSAFEEAVYDSSDNEDDNNDERDSGRGKNRNAKQFILETGDNPLDLLDSQTLAHISSTKVRSANKQQHRKKREDDAFSFDADGKLVVKGRKSADINEEDPLKSVTSGINAYLEAVKHGPVRGQNNKLKFKKGSRAGDNDDEDDEKLPPKKFDSRNKVGKGGFKRNNPKFKSKRKF